MSETVMVQNLTNNDVIYIDNDGGVERRIIFRGQQLQKLPKDMIERMQYDQGGSVLLHDYLSVKDENIRADIGVPEDQVEYDYTTKDVIALLESNDIDALEDALDFAPQAIKEMIVEEAVNLPLNNREMTKIISEKMDKNIESMILNQEQHNKSLGENAQPSKPKNSQRRKAAKQETEVKIINGQEIVVPKK